MIVSVIMPAYNERATIRDIVSQVLSQPSVLELIIIDDGSTDGTRDIIDALDETHDRIRSICLPENQGKGAATRAGIAAARVFRTVCSSARPVSSAPCLTLSALVRTT